MIMEKIKVNKVIICKQGKNSENYRKFKDIVERKKIEVIVVKGGERVQIDKEVYFDILFPRDNLIQTNILNNNSIVAKLCYGKASMLLTGDIEEVAEKAIIEEYKNTDLLKSTILKVAHHGSKSSSIKEFLNAVQPKIAIIGVGSKNTFGHPNKKTIERLKDMGTKIYRTDENGEISIRITNKGTIRIKKKIGK